MDQSLVRPTVKTIEKKWSMFVTISRLDIMESQQAEPADATGYTKLCWMKKLWVKVKPANRKAEQLASALRNPPLCGVEGR